ncbi:DUF488 domain-containing protein [Ornithinibacillus halophilus]|uniref:DUF488 domain-containing protein n=1 Tax=Ornithinibacillus halophilus TaxID=930117 RepID=UPI001F214B01|nr:DUF488 domain-containing protein [Ornithinibacillus halophilus]
MNVTIKRIYDSVDKTDGYRVLVDRLWPRGISKEKAHLDLWLKDVAPTSELRKTFGHDVSKFEAFKKEYIKELQEGKQQEAFQRLREIVRENDQVTLLYGAKDKRHNQAVILKELMGQ